MLAQTNVIYFINTVFISEVNAGMYVYVTGVLLKDCMPIFFYHCTYIISKFHLDHIYT